MSCVDICEFSGCTNLAGKYGFCGVHETNGSNTMSNKPMPEKLTNNELADRLKELTIAAIKGKWDEFCMEVPPNYARDFDFVMTEAVKRLRAIESSPVAVVINNNQPGWTAIIETQPNVTLDIGTKIYAAAPSPEPASGELERLQSKVEELEQQVCDECSPDDYGWNYNAVEGRVPCVCITESGAYQELLVRVKEQEGGE